MSTTTLPIILSRFNDGLRRAPALPSPKELRNVVQDLQSGRIFTGTRFGRKQQWKPEQSQRYIIALLEQRFQVDAISISRITTNGRTIDRAINGNNRLRSILKFVNNEFGIPHEHEGRIHTFYYSRIPESELEKPSRRKLVHLLPEQYKNAFDNFSILFNIRESLTEQQEIEWYEELNTNMVSHTDGHLLISRICDSSLEVNDLFLETFPVMKSRIGLEITEDDANSFGNFLEELTGVRSPDPLNEDDKKEDVSLGLANTFGLLLNGHTYDGKFKGEVNRDILRGNIDTVKHVFQQANISEDLLEEFDTGVHRKQHQLRFWQPRYLLGPIAWSIATRQPGAVEVWIQFLNQARAGTIDRVYLDPIAKLSGHADDKEKTYNTIWELVNEELRRAGH
jgi:hypothetical protein